MDIRMFWDRISFMYDNLESFNNKANKEMTRICASHLEDQDKVLECACGTGIITSVMAPNCRQIVATDFSPNMLDEARKKLRGRNNVFFEEGDITNLKYADNSFDKAVAGNVIHLLDEPRKAVEELKRVVKPGGLIIIPTYMCDGNRLVNSMKSVFKRTFNEESYRRFWNDMGLKPQYETAHGLMDCCVALITNEK